MSTRTRARGCAGKLRHATRKSALGHLWRLVRKQGASRTTLNVYRCKFCRNWHVGHIMRGRR